MCCCQRSCAARRRRSPSCELRHADGESNAGQRGHTADDVEDAGNGTAGQRCIEVLTLELDDHAGRQPARRKTQQQEAEKQQDHQATAARPARRGQ